MNKCNLKEFKTLVDIHGIKLTGGFENGALLKDAVNIIWPLANL